MCIIISKNQSNAHISQETSQLMPEFSWLLDNMSPVTLDKIITFWLLINLSQSLTFAESDAHFKEF